MKILLVAKYFYPIKGGIETVVYETAKCLKNLGNEVTVVTVGKKSKETINGINIIRTPALFSISGEPAAIGFFKENVGKKKRASCIQRTNKRRNKTKSFCTKIT